MPKTLRAGLRRAITIAASAALLLGLLAIPAQAGLNTWTGLLGLNAASGASWVRTYATAAPPAVTTIYAGTEGDGIYKSTTDGVSWLPFSSGLDTPGAKSVRVIYTGGGKVYAGTEAGLFSSDGTGAWTPVAQGPEDDPAHPKRLNASVQAVLSVPLGGLLAGTAFHGVYRSMDGGQTWTPPAPGNGMVEGATTWGLTAVGPIVFAATTEGVYRSLDFGSTWSLASDGIPGSATTLRVIADGTNRNIVYVATASDGIYRSIDLGITWAPINDGLGDDTVRGIQQFSGATTTRLYAATDSGLWTGSTGNGPVPGAVSWRHVTEDGLGGHTIMWDVSNFRTPPGTLLVGTEGDGGFALTFAPPVNTSPPTVTALGSLQVGQTAISSPGVWAGTPTIDYDRQWQLCDPAPSNRCTDIDSETGVGYTIRPTDAGKRLRLEVTAHNDFPEPGPLAPKADSAISAVIAPNPGTLPGAGQHEGADIVVLGLVPSLPSVGDTLHATNWLFNPTPDVGRTYFQWLRCDVNGDHCDPIPGASGQDYRLTNADVALRLRVRVSGTNVNGTAVLPDSGASNTIFPHQATVVTPPTLTGTAHVGSTLVGGVGSWESPLTTWARQWEQCEPDGSGCSFISGETSPGYVVRPDDLGMTLRMSVVADVNGPNTYPDAVDADTPVSAVVTLPPPSPGTGGAGPAPAPGPAPGPGPKPPAPPKPTVKKPSIKVGEKTTRKGVTLTAKLSEAGSLKLVVERKTTGHKAGKRCRAGRKRHAKACTLWTTLGSLTKQGLKPSKPTTIVLGHKVGRQKLTRGRYRVLVTPRDKAGHPGKTATVAFRVK